VIVMAETNEPRVRTQEDRPKSATSKSEETVHVELLATSWMEKNDDGSFTRHWRGAKVDIPTTLYDKLGDESDHFKPSFRKVAKED
jgi:hypothetical protein